MNARLAPLLALFPVLIAGAGAAACGGASTGEPTIPAATATSTPGPPSPTPFATFTPTPEIGVGAAIVVGGDLRVRSGPSTQTEEVGSLEDLARVTIDTAVSGENWLVGDQTWVTTVPGWTSTWYRLTDGTYVYAAFVFVLQPGENSPLTDAAGREKWIDVNVTAQTATAMIGDTPLYVAKVSTGSRSFPSPLGTHRIEEDGRLPVERMTSSQAGYSAQQARYDVERVLFTQYFDRSGDALHLNYWRPAAVFGNTATSHGCVGMQLHDAQYFWLFGEPGMRVEIHL
jgi:lipoprotein-anchoring transpeptidase ErfK/SrfK